MSWFVKQYFSMLAGIVVGAVIATLTTMSIYGDVPLTHPEAFQKCLVQYATTGK